MGNINSLAGSLWGRTNPVVLSAHEHHQIHLSQSSQTLFNFTNVSPVTKKLSEICKLLALLQKTKVTDQIMDQNYE